MALQVFREVATNLHSGSLYTIMANETTDISNQEQLVLCLRWVDDKFDVHEEFIGLYDITSTSANTVVAAIKDALLRMNRSVL